MFRGRTPSPFEATLDKKNSIINSKMSGNVEKKISNDTFHISDMLTDNLVAPDRALQEMNENFLGRKTSFTFPDKLQIRPKRKGERLHSLESVSDLSQLSKMTPLYKGKDSNGV